MMCKIGMRIQSTDERKRRWEHLQKATGENTTAGELDVTFRPRRSAACHVEFSLVGSVETLIC